MLTWGISYFLSSQTQIKSASNRSRAARFGIHACLSSMTHRLLHFRWSDPACWLEVNMSYCPFWGFLFKGTYTSVKVQTSWTQIMRFSTRQSQHLCNAERSFPPRINLYRTTEKSGFRILDVRIKSLIQKDQLYLLLNQMWDWKSFWHVAICILDFERHISLFAPLILVLFAE